MLSSHSKSDIKVSTLSCAYALAVSTGIWAARKFVRQISGRVETYWVESQYNAIHNILTYYELEDLGFTDAMNLGYDEAFNTDSTPSAIEIPSDTSFGTRLQFQLYRRVLRNVLSDGPVASKVLEVSCGRGGGTEFVANISKKHTVTGLDLSHDGITYCQQRYSQKNLTFEQGDAQALNYADRSFDVVLNVESSHCYPDYIAFFSQVARVLKPGGYFCFCDITVKEAVPFFTGVLDKLGVELVEQEDITEAVVSALRSQGEKREIALSKLPFFVRPLVSNIIGGTGSMTFSNFENGNWCYVRLLCRKKLA